MRHSTLAKAESPEALSAELRHSDDPLMQHRRQVVCLSLLSATCMGVVAAYQIGLLKHVPEPPLPMFDADKVDASAQAYEKLSTGDAFLGFVSYGVTMLLAAIGGSRRHETHPAIPIAMGGKAVVDAAQAAKLTVDQWVQHRAFCSWCLMAAASTFAVIPAVLPELRAALRTIRRPASTAAA
jgi:Vitamin K epoxide reductase family